MIEQAVIISLIVLSIHYTMQEGEIFGGLGRWFENNLPYQIHPAVFDCNVCMTPWYGSVLYWVIPWQKVSIPPATIELWPVVIIVAMGLGIMYNRINVTGIKNEIEEIEEKL